MATEADQNSEQVVQEMPELEATTSDTGSTESTSTEVTGEQEKQEATKEQTPAYKPDYKLKVYDEEKELDDPFLKALIKDADSEKKVKEIAQKFLGFETVKSRHEKTKEEYKNYQEQVQPVVQYYNEAAKHLAKGDLDSFFELTKIPKQAIFEYAVRKAQEEQLPVEQQRQIAYQREVAKQKELVESQNQTLQTQMQRQMAEFRNQELSWVLSRPDVHEVASQFDQRKGKPGAFRQEVIDKALAHFVRTNGQEDLTAEQAVLEAMKLIGPVVTPATQGAQAVQGTTLIPQNEAPPIIPNVSGKGSSPVKKQIRSISDLKKKREELRT